jgi:palmitoyltransferase
LSLAYFLNLGLDINSKDKRQSTPLHWAAFAGAELALSYIVAKGADVNCQDIKGLTPLHLAVRSSQESFQSRCIRTLMLKGANPTIEAGDGKKPQNYLDEFDIRQPLIRDFQKTIFEIL